MWPFRKKTIPTVKRTFAPIAPREEAAIVAQEKQWVLLSDVYRSHGNETHNVSGRGYYTNS